MARQRMMMRSGKIVEITKDTFRLFPQRSAIQPAAVGPTRQPMSPAMASRANIRTPP